MRCALSWRCALAAATLAACSGPPWETVASVPNSSLASILSQGSIYVLENRGRVIRVALPAGTVTEVQAPRWPPCSEGSLVLARRELVSACRRSPSGFGYLPMSVVPVDGGPARDLEAVYNGPLTLASDGTSAYWVGEVASAGSGPPLEIRAVPLAGGASTVVVRPQRLSRILARGTYPLAVDDAFVYYFVDLPSERLVRVPKGGGAEELVVETSLSAGPVVDGADLVWIQFGQVVRRARAGGQVSLIGVVPGNAVSLDGGGGSTWFVASSVPDPVPQDGPIGESVREYLVNGSGAGEITPNAGSFLGIDGSGYYWIRYERDVAWIVRTAAR